MRIPVVSVAFALLLGLAGRAEAEPAKGLPPALVDAYLTAADTLASDSLKGVPEALARVADEAGKAKLAAVQKAAREIRTTSLGETRKGFKALSQAVVAAHQANPGAPVKVFYCGMAKALWLQKDAAVRNPYHGSEMLTCGEQVQ